MTLDRALAVVTGASSGIGAATARALAARGSHVVLLARNAERFTAVADDIKRRGGKADIYPVDLANPGAIASAAAHMTEAHGAADILVNNAGAGRWLPILETGAEEAAAMMAVPYLAAFNVTRELLPGMLARHAGHIVNVTSVAARLGMPGAVAYSAARAAMEGFTNALRADLYGTGIGVTLAMFGTVETPYWAHNPGSRERLSARAARVPSLSAETVATLICTAIEGNKRMVLAPKSFRFLFLMNRLFPAQVDRSMAGR